MESTNLIVFYDAQCPFCVGWIKFLLDRDGDDRLRFASLQSGWSGSFFQQKGLSHPGTGSVLVWDGVSLYRQSEAVITVAGVLPGAWKAGRQLKHLPAGVRDGIYDFIAARRYNWFGKYAKCWLPKPDEQRKFLDLSDPVYQNPDHGDPSKDA